MIGEFDNEYLYLKVYDNNDGFIIVQSSNILKQDVIIKVGSNNEVSVNIPFEGETDSAILFAINNSLMLLYTYFASSYNTLLIHSSTVINKNGDGFAFHAKSGTGKSTHSRLWIENIEGVELLNDDNPIIRVIDDNVYIYGSPWSGKTPCYRNIKANLKAFVRIIRAPQNKIEKLHIIKSYASLLPSFSCLKWCKEHEKNVHSTIEKIITKTNCYHLECLPNADAAIMCNHIVSK